MSLYTDLLAAGLPVTSATDGNPRIRIGVNSTSSEYSDIGLAVATLVGRLSGGATQQIIPSLGYNFVVVTEFSTAGVAPGVSFEVGAINGFIFA